MKKLSNFFILSLMIFFSTTAAHANAGLPMISVAWPFMWSALIPIVVVEFFVMRKWLKTYSATRLVFTVSFSNVISTLVGIPMVWFVLVMLQLTIPGAAGTFPQSSDLFRAAASVTIQAPWLLPYQDYMHIMIPSALIFLLVPFFFASYWIESWLSVKLLGHSSEDRQTIRKATWRANLISYVLLAFMVVLSYIFQSGEQILLLKLVPHTFMAVSLYLPLLVGEIHSYVRIAIIVLALAFTFWAFRNRNK